MKKIGIIVVFYNLSHYVEECLNSIKNQSFADFKCICVDDRSTDDTFEKLQQFAANDDRFIAIQNEKNYSEIYFKKDLYGNDRIVVGRLK